MIPYVITIMQNLDQPIVRISKLMSLEYQIFFEDMMDDLTNQGLFEKTIDPDTREPVYLEL